MTANNKKPMTQAERQAFLGQTFTLREIFRILWDAKPAAYKNLTTGRFEDDGQQTLDNLEDRFRAEALEKLAAKPASLLREPVEVPAANPGKPIERNATNDQIAHVMLMHGTPDQQRQALEYAGVQPASKPEEVAPYDAIFGAIRNATEVQTSKAITVSVARFKESLAESGYALTRCATSNKENNDDA